MAPGRARSVWYLESLEKAAVGGCWLLGDTERSVEEQCVDQSTHLLCALHRGFAMP